MTACVCVWWWWCRLLLKLVFEARLQQFWKVIFIWTALLAFRLCTLIWQKCSRFSVVLLALHKRRQMPATCDWPPQKDTHRVLHLVQKWWNLTTINPLNLIKELPVPTSNCEYLQIFWSSLFCWLFCRTKHEICRNNLGIYWFHFIGAVNKGKRSALLLDTSNFFFFFFYLNQLQH